MKRQRKAVALISGGLDSMLAAKLVKDQGVEVEGINFFTGFCVEGHTQAIRHSKRDKIKRNNALWAAEQIGIKLHIVEVIEEYKDIVINPKHGYGANLNPCLDCKGFMVAKALEWMHQHDFDFIVTGEVIGQRPMSQRAETMPIIAKESGADDRLVRPLSAKLLPPTLPETEGWIDREKLRSLSGRSRKPQIAMAKDYGYLDFAQPAGGCCFLTDEKYADKLRDLWQARGDRDYEFDDIMLLKIGRHLRPKPHFKMIISRDAGETRFLHGYRKQFISLYPTSHKGPLCLIDGAIKAEDLPLASSIVARYSQGRDAKEVTINIRFPNLHEQELNISPLSPKEVQRDWIL